MKKLAFLSSLLLLAASCVDTTPAGPGNDTADADFGNISSVREMSVPVPEGKTAVVTDQAGGQIARVSRSAVILVDKHTTPTVTYVDAVEGDENSPVTTSLWQVIAFEDSIENDYDYNDLVIHVKYEISGNYFILGIQPIALGSTKKFALGCDVWQDGKYLKQNIRIAEDCREKFFPGSGKRMINTFAVEKDYCVFDFKPYYRSNYIPLTNRTKPVYVNWFIEVDGGRRFYAVSTNRTNGMLDMNKRPYGLVLSATGYDYTQPGSGTVGKDWFNYPRETTPIDEVYPLFGKWLKGEYTGTLQSMYDPSAEGAFDAIGEGLYIVPWDQTSVGGKPSVRSHVIPLNKTENEMAEYNW